MHIICCFGLLSDWPPPPPHTHTHKTTHTHTHTHTHTQHTQQQQQQQHTHTHTHTHTHWKKQKQNKERTNLNKMPIRNNNNNNNNNNSWIRISVKISLFDVRVVSHLHLPLRSLQLVCLWFTRGCFPAENTSRTPSPPTQERAHAHYSDRCVRIEFHYYLRRTFGILKYAIYHLLV